MAKNALQPYVPGIRVHTVMMGNVTATLITNATTLATAHVQKVNFPHVTNIIAIATMVIDNV